MTAKKLVLLTAHFPFFPGEQFLETEIEYLARAFESVLIVPVKQTEDADERRRLPANAIVRLLPDDCRAYGIFRRLRRLPYKHWPCVARRTLKELIDWGNLPVDLLSPVSLSHALAGFDVLKSFFGALLAEDLRGSEVVLYSYWFDHWLAPLAELRREGRCAAAIVTRAHGYDVFPEQSHIPLRSGTVPFLDHIYVVSRSGVDTLRKLYPGASQRISCRRLGVRAAGSRSARSTDGVFRIVSCSAFTDVKRVERIASALRLVRFDTEWTHFGEGPRRAIVERHIASLPSNVRVNLRGQVRNDEVLNHYATHPVDVFLNVSWSEGMPVSIMEALSHGIPVVATDVGGVGEAIDSDNGSLLAVDFRDEQLAELLDAMRSMVPERVCGMRDRAIETWAQYFDADSNYAQFSAELRAWATNPPQPDQHV